MLILEELYDGNIAPMERDIRRGSEYHKILKRIDEQQKSLALSLSREDMALYESIAESKCMLDAISEKEMFIEGFRLGAQIMLEVLTEPDRELMPI